MTNKKARLAALCICLLSFLFRPTEAQVINGTFDGFTSVSHPNWDGVGLIGGRFASIPNAPSSSDPPATISTPDSFSLIAPEGGASPAEIAALLGVATADIHTLDTSSEEPIFGSAIAQTFDVGAGQVLTFEWNFVSYDSVSPDFGFVYLSGPGGTVLARLAGQEDVSPPPDDLDGISGETGLMAYATGPLAAGTYRFGLGAINSSSNSGTSALVVDNVTLVPEPSACLTKLLALVCVGLHASRRRTAFQFSRGTD